MHLLNRVHILFATIDAAAVEMWATTDVPLSAPQRASIILVAPKICNHCRKRGLPPNKWDNTIYLIYLPTTTVFWSFMHIANGSSYDPVRGTGLTEHTLLDAWMSFTVPGGFIKKYNTTKQAMTFGGCEPVIYCLGSSQA
ncbi:hypothetical protein P692DRAFT_20820966 [Suillus brevipes Sb2]|nr:hypothetical protein P692DRAFT_20820966 [Suillus brevipes Sb2]